MAGIPEEKISYTEKETDTPEKLKLFENDNIYVLYGTDSIRLGYTCLLYTSIYKYRQPFF